MSWLDELYQINTGTQDSAGGKTGLSIDPERFGALTPSNFDSTRFGSGSYDWTNPLPITEETDAVKDKNTGKSGENASEVCETCCEVITGTKLKEIFTTASIGDLNSMADELNYSINVGKIDSVERLTHFLGQVREEAGPSLRLTENLAPWTSKGLKNKFSYYKKHPDLADQHGNFVATKQMKKEAKEQGLPEPMSHGSDPEKIANTIYDDANRSASRKLGNTEPGDGWKYRGRGLKQLTGRYNYDQFTKGYANYWSDEPQDFVKNPELVAEMKYAVRSALWFWLAHDLPSKADGGISDDVTDSITDVVNKGTPYAPRRDHVNDINKKQLFKKICFNTNKNLSNFEAKEPK
ncbi:MULTISPECIES: glycoside hydrolase family 19 protein [Rhizobium/Agrobacterium group]|uniref:glycoside hydrolase family 19 protein n=1 Tax=Rhizobium/Agrobacterium group TaxID=227290 RepID=UPI000B3FDDE0|nr:MULTISPECIES: glycoside hydrolase family 19 protein [Rhizobium/Agrobacterium group]NSZ41588.1 hypothetical protein [Agrobacterium vitis]NTA25271.1 hypothetical protein [Allorhizobium ampelinum]OVE98107.1 hypothetical protein B7W85_01990 [Allorhizobium ampelinum]